MESLKLNNLKKSFGNNEIIKGVNLSISDNEIHAIIGPNGAGKSTLFNLISHRFEVTDGQIIMNGTDVTLKNAQQISRMGLSRSFQITNIFPKMTVRENIRCSLLWYYGYKYSFFHRISSLKDVNNKTDQLLEQVNLTSKSDLEASLLTYAEQRALEIGITISSDPSIILLDEPTAGMSKIETSQTVDLIKKVTKNKTLLMVEHDMGVIFDLADKISVLVDGRIIATDIPKNIKDNKSVQEAYLGKEN